MLMTLFVYVLDLEWSPEEKLERERCCQRMPKMQPMKR